MKTVIEMAREAGFANDVEECADMVWVQDTEITEKIERFAALVRADEREACAKLCETKHFSSPVREFGAKDCVAAIRARGNT